ncbi:hypothetical protein [Brevibacillus sp. H7]|jgi:hypothetical protein|uniref:hypothetical protein n=1 Tax=Brevibacillus sp. H7 TaxID=3349138 RepID=UPI0037FA8D5F
MAFFLINGWIAGMILAAFLALCDGLFQTETLTVLIDVSYVPVFAGLPSIVELLIHLVLSVIVTFVLIGFYPRISGWPTVKYLLYWLLAFTVIYFPFTMLSGVAISLAAFVVWVLGHLIYTLYLAVQVERYR